MESQQQRVLSVIIAAYNVEKYIDKCLKSIAYQTYKSFEVIIVNDGSTDRTQEIAERYCAEDKRFHLINKVNGGLLQARKTGVIYAIGSY